MYGSFTCKEPSIDDRSFFRHGRPTDPKIKPTRDSAQWFDEEFFYVNIESALAVKFTITALFPEDHHVARPKEDLTEQNKTAEEME